MNLVGSRCTTSIFLMLSLMTRAAEVIEGVFDTHPFRRDADHFPSDSPPQNDLEYPERNTQKTMNTRKKVRSLPVAPAISIAVLRHASKPNQLSSISRRLRQ